MKIGMLGLGSMARECLLHGKHVLCEKSLTVHAWETEELVQLAEMYAIAAVVLGGVSMSGGKGRCLGILFGAMSYTVIDKIIVGT